MFCDSRMTTLLALLRAARLRLSSADLDDPQAEARILIEHFTGTSRIDLIARADMEVERATVDAVEAAVTRRLAYEPVHRIIGFREFHGLKLFLSAETLEPRPDTETLVDAVLPFVADTAERFGTCRILDLGTGTGAIALALIDKASGATATGVDISADALATARRNAIENGLSARFDTLRSDWFDEISGCYHAIVANPPYIPSQDIPALQPEVRQFDPVRALDGGADGLDPYRTIAAQAAGHLEEDGVVAVEIGHTQKQDVAAIFSAAGYRMESAHRDLGGNDRALIFVRK